ncbi:MULTISPECIES: hypothetical protein [unclassified Colwellia]|uniref:hypothetical protein n=1 Tax=unclassified Colwellia TaxID=196834 RepID=UPI0015F3C29A|nr:MULTISPECIES: hypothetical protein [unclassified Colwellia]MBA6233046.1 hypothetical protein [Colwellia sp. MB02u-7]MBA6236724.1 hypothetical protein [Colwellia sp. MB02u-11]MBA6255916.1 hypothetical protein [Colwellia sp. MB3u-28]MBA6262058.1 hypothetical protein [Colwellia sp. MB3u-41]MBA6299026.1 hypothetical protein [Colwellia sp. MB3u-22]
MIFTSAIALLRQNAIQYANYALGKFINKEKTYWKDTVSSVVADHDARALGNELVPIKNFHTPGVILIQVSPLSLTKEWLAKST